MTRDENTLRILAAARTAWQQGADLRSRRDRYKRYTYGDQWSDIVRGNDGTYDTARNHALRRGQTPLSNNLIRRLVRCIIGRYRMLRADSPVTDPTLRPLYDANCLDEIDARALEEFLISGCCIQRIVAETRRQGHGVWVDNVSPARFFISPIGDPRGWDTELIGMAHDMSIFEIIMRFARGDRRRATHLRQLYNSLDNGASSPFLGRSDTDGDSLTLAPKGRCRVIEVWTLEASERLACHDPLDASLTYLSPDSLESINATNAERTAQHLPNIATRWSVDTRWRCRWIAPDGTLLDSYDSPYADGSHPFVVKLYPLTDGEVHSLVEDVIDQQVYVNRLITLIDQVIGTSAKGVLLFPESQLSEEFTWEDVARMWASPDGIIPYRARPDDPTPTQVISGAADIGARELLQLQMKMFEDVSGVSNALMGRSSSGGNIGVERYESEVRNATISINDILMTFNHFRSMRDSKLISCGN